LFLLLTFSKDLILFFSLNNKILGIYIYKKKERKKENRMIC